ncbi:MAG TPA: dipeptide/oligopeptide/nickel ABC transporter ATP-binding protein, partial [Terriglobales bacterium]|nr:dipeptide/oligopeptide/nickel ABC transporter ATP-binding protein [Terriglobales bacterium]
TFDIPRGKTLALIGSSGSGKSTVARCVSRIETPDEGEIWIGDTNIARLPPSVLRPFRSRIQMIFQDAASAINPRFTAQQVVEEPLLFQEHTKRKQLRHIVGQLMRELGLRPEWAERRAHDFSGGQKQRLVIARALALKPEILILDEALGGLDLSTQAQIANLLLDLQASRSLTYLLISHDLRLVAQITDSVAVMSAGKIVEQGAAAQILEKPVQEETRRLVGLPEVRAITLAAGAGGRL